MNYTVVHLTDWSADEYQTLCGKLGIDIEDGALMTPNDRRVTCEGCKVVMTARKTIEILERRYGDAPVRT